MTLWRLRREMSLLSSASVWVIGVSVLTAAMGLLMSADAFSTTWLMVLAVFLTNLVFKSFNPLMRGSPRAIATLLLRNVFIGVLAIGAARVLALAPLATDSDPGVE